MNDEQGPANLAACARLDRCPTPQGHRRDRRALPPRGLLARGDGNLACERREHVVAWLRPASVQPSDSTRSNRWPTPTPSCSAGPGS